MNMEHISVPEIYKESQDFRFFLNWFQTSLSKIKYDTENFMDLFDPQRCPQKLLWMLADTMGFKYDSRLSTAFNRLVLLYFMSMIRNRGSKDGVTLAAEVNLGQFILDENAKEYYENSGDDIYYNRLSTTQIPVNSVYVTPHTEQGFIEVVYFSDKVPIDACIEYVRPLGMYLFQFAGVRYDARTKISVDARLTDSEYVGISIGPTHVGHYRREDYARMQKQLDETMLEPGVMSGYQIVDKYTWEEKDGQKQITDHWYQIVTPDGTVVKDKLVSKYDAISALPKLNENDKSHKRNPVWYRNSDYEGEPDKYIDPGYRALYSLQLCNNEHVVKALIGHDIYSLGFGPTEEGQTYPDDYNIPLYKDKPVWNLRYDKAAEEELGHDVYSLDEDRTTGITSPKPAVNPIMMEIGDAIALDDMNTKYTDK